MDLRGKTAIVTGGGTGLGRAISLRLAAEGSQLAIVYSRSEREARETAAECTAGGSRAIIARADVAIESEVRVMVDQVREQLGRVDVLVNNAGWTVFHPIADLEAIQEADWDRIMAVNVKAHFFTARAVAPLMREQGGGAIVNITSIAGLAPRGSSLPYVVSKAGAIMLCKCLALALAPAIRVNNVAPGLLRTRWWGDTPVELVEEYEQTSALKRATPIEDVAEAVLLAVTNDSITGQTIVVDSGLHFH